MIGKGRAKALDANAFARMAVSLKCHPADLQAISIVESGGFGWFKDGRIKLLFEKHWFYKKLPKSMRASAARKGLARRSWISPKRGGYKEQRSASSRYRILEQAIAVHERAAYESASYGTYQIMGFNYKKCGFNNAKEMFEAFVDGEQAQLEAFVSFLRSVKLVTAIRQRNFGLVEKRYNGGGLKGAYARRMKIHSDKLRRTKWKNWNPNSVPPAPPVQAQKPKSAPKTPETSKKPASKTPLLIGGALVAIGSGIAATWDEVTAWISYFLQ